MSKRWSRLAIVAAVLLWAGPAFAQDGGSAVGEDPGDESEAADMEANEASESSDESGESESPMAADEESSGGDMGMSSESEETSRSATEETDTSETAETTAGGHPSTNSILVAAPHIGVAVPSLFNDLGTWPIFSAELGVMPPMEEMNNPLEIAVYAHYTQPGSSGQGTDANLGAGGAGADYSWELTQRTLTLDLVGIWRFRNLADKLDPYGLIGPRLSLMETTMTAEGNAAQFGEVRETNTEVGLVLGGGVDYQLGPGTLFGELKFGWTNMDQALTGNTNAGQFTFDVGYRFYAF